MNFTIRVMQIPLDVFQSCNFPSWMQMQFIYRYKDEQMLLTITLFILMGYVDSKSKVEVVDVLRFAANRPLALLE